MLYFYNIISTYFNIYYIYTFIFVVVVQSLSHVWLFTTPWTAAHQTSLSFTISWSLLKLMSTESMMASNHLILYRLLFLLSSVVPSIRVFSKGRFFESGGQRIGASASVLPMDIQGPVGASDGKESACNSRGLGWIPGLGRCPGGGHGNSLQYSCLENHHG